MARTKPKSESMDKPDGVQLVRSQPSVEIKRDAKGQVQYTVKVYHDDPSMAFEEAQKVMKWLDEAYRREIDG